MNEAKLPELPPPGIQTAHPMANAFAYGYHANQMRAYGAACFAAGMERAAVICEECMGFDEDDPGASAAAAIRSLVEQEKASPLPGTGL